MVTTHIKQIQGDKTYVYIPSFLRKEFGLTKETPVDITMEGDKIVIKVLFLVDKDTPEEQRNPLALQLLKNYKEFPEPIWKQ